MTLPRPAADRPARPETHLVVTAVERLSPGMVRVRFASDDLSAFAGSEHTDRYVKIVFPQSDGSTVVRTYTALEPDVDEGSVAIDFVVHGDEGVAGPWAAGAKPGDTLSVRGPGGGYAPDPTADWHLLAGDESALPAIRAALAALPAAARGYAVVEVSSAEHEQTLAAPSGVDVVWVHAGAPNGRALADAEAVEPPLLAAVRSLDWLPGRVQAFVHGEAQVVMHGLRPFLLRERVLPRADVSISGYWRRGRTEESFRQWKRALTEAEAATGAA